MNNRDDMKRIVICKYCNKPEFYGRMMWLSGKCCCRACYKADYEKETGKPYKWSDLDGPVPTWDQYRKQEDIDDDGRTTMD